jgi:hypothetical protein
MSKVVKKGRKKVDTKFEKRRKNVVIKFLKSCHKFEKRQEKVIIKLAFVYLC